jgi:RNA ligase (TIGR02306 family)
MNDIVTRKLASVQKIAEKKPIEGADNIEAVRVNGWWMVTQKSNNFQVGDLVVYFEVDSFLPVREEFEFLRKGCFKSTPNLGDGFRLRTIKLRGQVSQGLVLPMETFFKKYPRDSNWYANDMEVNYVVEGDDLTERLGVQKYEAPLSPQLAGKAKGNFPSFIRKTDQERIQNIYNDLVKTHKDVKFQGTMKLDGSSMTVYLYNNGSLAEPIFGVCSRNLDLQETDDNTFWQVARNLRIEGALRKIGRNIALQGELMGPGVQGNREGFKEHRFFLFDVWDIDNQKYLSCDEMVDVSIAMGLNGSPMDRVARVSSGYPLQLSLDELIEASNINSYKHPVAEGIVYRSLDGSTSFKVINQQFLLNEKN